MRNYIIHHPSKSIIENHGYTLEKETCGKKKGNSSCTLLPLGSTRGFFRCLLRELLNRKAGTIRPEKHQLPHLKEMGNPTSQCSWHTSTLPRKILHLSALTRPRKKKHAALSSFSYHFYSLRTTRQCCSRLQTRAAWANGAGHAMQWPKDPHSFLQRAPSRCFHHKGPGTPGHGQTLIYRAAPVLEGHGGLLLPQSGAT